MNNPPAIVWFRQDLRVTDNPALSHAVETGQPVVPVFILDDEHAGDWRAGAASRWWLHRSLENLNASLGGRLRFMTGNAEEILSRLIRDTQATAVFWNRCYEPWRIDRDRRIKAALRDGGVEVETFNASLLFEPWTVMKPDGTPYRVFTPFYRKGCLQRSTPPDEPEPAPALPDAQAAASGSELDALGLLPNIPWYESFESHWSPGEAGARQRLEAFLEDGIRDYRNQRNRPDLPSVSRLSPHLHFGEISPREIWHAARFVRASAGLEDDVDHFLSELGWREFSYYLLYHFPEMPRSNLQPKFDEFPWVEDPDALAAWQAGMTGIPIVDAGMRELWQTGYMHNRVRMVVASFLVKNLLLHWHHGEDWFWDTLLDADLANNSASWQWVAGSGADAAPYFRIFNPVTQGRKFDPEGSYVRQFVPELASLPSAHIHAPWEAPQETLVDAGVRLGESYPQPLVDLKASRQRALEAFQSLRGR
jgi:deoxyribodipyrimidine photo-lyase